ncbi:deoxyadenosine/deoxycytidine kinase [Natronospira proteinivora]|uniref:Deoxyadenosine/deoxycytidine kinase n=1 Tax=Natronospira proteinivora TaxID=1807133 RepID=A0ABT1G755_9GAMM|nr:deoxynucleoside kinase [Natronospira proteinivora]MCP1726198.1 deoxyadenosine/deoxycytidine kinase [Natronospira proteinivora]
MSRVDVEHRYIVVEGPIGVGKTSFARRLAEDWGAELMLEGAEANPFLERFYEDPRGAALPTQLFFLYQRAQQIQQMRQSDLFQAERRVSDFLLEKDKLFAELNLDENEFQLYEQAYGHLSLDAPQPDLVVYLQAPVPVLMERIRRRGIAYEQQITADYLERLVDAYTRFFHHYEQAPLLIVNTADINPVDREADYKLLLEQLRQVRSGRHFFNPSPIA